MTRAYVGLGSNIEPETNLRAAVRLLAELESVVSVSTFYRNGSIPPGAPAFVNGAVALDTSTAPRRLKTGVLGAIEVRLGRMRAADRNAPRPIDCDLLVYGDDVVDERGLVLPSRDIEERAFIAVPLFEIAPELVLPGSGKALAEVVAALPPHPMAPLVDLSRALRAVCKEVQDGPGARRGARARAAH